MPGYLLDTQTTRYWFDGSAGKFSEVQAAAESKTADSPLYISAITLGEIEYGHAVYPEGAGLKRDEFVEFVRKQLPQVLFITKHTAEPYGRLRAQLTMKFPPECGWKANKKKRAEQMYDPIDALKLGIDENDLWIVAQAVERNLILVTSDKMFRIHEAVAEIEPRFRIENWALGTTAGGD